MSHLRKRLIKLSRNMEKTSTLHCVGLIHIETKTVFCCVMEETSAFANTYTWLRSFSWRSKVKERFPRFFSHFFSICLSIKETSAFHFKGFIHGITKQFSVALWKKLLYLVGKIVVRRFPLGCN